MISVSVGAVQPQDAHVSGWKSVAVSNEYRPCAHGDMSSLAPHERLPEVLVVPREKTPTGAAA